jgi:hypothetical protein
MSPHCGCFAAHAPDHACSGNVLSAACLAAVGQEETKPMHPTLVSCAMLTAPRPPLPGSQSSSAPLRPLWSWLVMFAARALSYWAVCALLGAFVEPPSRRACNASYVAWVCAMALSMLLLLLLTELFGAPAGRLPRLLGAVNRNMLPLFLVGNLLTGAANLAVDTLGASAATARLILGACTWAVTRLQSASLEHCTEGMMNGLQSA